MVITERGPSMQLKEHAGLAWFIHELRKDKQPFAVGVALRIGVAACERLTHAWERHDVRGRPRHAVHGSIAPSSIFLDPDGTVRVTRELVSAALSGHYPRAPEANDGPGTPQGDVFSLAVVLYEMLTGKVILRDPPKNPNEPEPPPEPFNLPPEPPSRFLRVDPRVDAVLLRALSADPAARYADAAEFGAALTALAKELGAPCTQEELGEWFKATFTPQRKRAREEQFAKMMSNLGDLAAQLEKLQSEMSKKPALAAVPPPPSEAEQAELDKSFEKFEQHRVASRRRFEVESSFEPLGALPPQTSSKQAFGLFTQLTELGFGRLGVKWETEVFSQIRVPSVVFASAEAKAFASVYVDHENKLCLFFTTPFPGGEQVVTARYPRPFERSARATFSAKPDAPLPELLELHQKAVASFHASGAQPVETFTQQTMLEATDDWYTSGLEFHDEHVEFLDSPFSFNA
jgi:hypothetical protein